MQGPEFNPRSGDYIPHAATKSSPATTKDPDLEQSSKFFKNKQTQINNNMRGKGNADMQAVRGPQTGYMHPQDAKDYPLQQRKNQIFYLNLLP